MPPKAVKIKIIISYFHINFKWINKYNSWNKINVCFKDKINHFFTGSRENAKELMDLGFYFSFGGVLTFTRDYDDVVKYVGLDRIVLETDAPYITPVPHRGERNEPMFVKHTAEKLADILGEELDTIEKKTTDNARKVLNLWFLCFSP